MFPWLRPPDGAFEFSRAKRASFVPPSAQAVVKQAFDEALTHAGVEMAPYLMPKGVRDAHGSRGLPPSAATMLGLGLAGMHLAGDTPTFSNKVRRTINDTLGTELDTETRAEAVLRALR